MRKFRKLFTTTFLLLFLILLNPNIANNSTGVLAKDNIEHTLLKTDSFIPLSKDSVNTVNIQLLNEIQTQILRYGPESKLQAISLLLVCKKYDFDIVLAMAQAQVESQYGTEGVASRTNSVFNVGTYDDGTILYRYKDPNQSIEPYTSLMTRNYLRNNKTAQDLLKPWSFVDYKGDRYATFKYYEYRVKKVYDQIITDTNIDDLYKIYMSPEYQRSVAFYTDYEAIVEYNDAIYSD